ncbi:hypothetical protein HGA13_07310 [Nocardia speluncae]|uniref:Uncharacterized protein n=1 Tax=Nocardia speluncae TaxID=419477 RepID=A0A846XE50_9NOCA|nr:hypothetical protein [Nocardia speluncae]NKY32883.1 hypothetical protein [Nocardia speluncae]
MLDIGPLVVLAVGYQACSEVSTSLLGVLRSAFGSPQNHLKLDPQLGKLGPARSCGEITMVAADFAHPKTTPNIHGYFW